MAGFNLTLWMGPSVPVPAALPLMEAFDSLEILQRDRGASGFQINFKPQRTGFDDAAHLHPQLNLFSRVIVVLTIKGLPHVLIDGLITHRQCSPDGWDISGGVSVMGEDLSALLDREEKTAEHPGQSEPMIALKILAQYAEYGLIPTVMPPPAVDLPNPIERTPVQRGTDLAYLRDMAARYGYLFYIEPGPAPRVNRAYWGPPKRLGFPQSAITANMGEATNVESIHLKHDALASERVQGSVQDRRMNLTLPVLTFSSTRQPPLARTPDLPLRWNHLRRVLPEPEGGLSFEEAMARAQGRTDASTDSVVTATGTLNGLKYGKPLKARGLVGLRGVGDTYNGLYYVQQVTHLIRKGNYLQNFILTREGIGATLPVVRP